MDLRREKEIFETMPVHRAVFTMAIPTILSELVTMVYNIADTLYIGRLGNPYMMAGIAVSYPLFFFMNALGNLFGVGGGSFISRLLGATRDDEVKHVSSFSFFGSTAMIILYSLCCLLFMDPILYTLGASGDSIGYAKDYTLWVAVIGGPPTLLGIVIAHPLRSEGHARQASAGMMLGGILNIILDPIFIFLLHMNVAGVAIATAISNYVSFFYFTIIFAGLKGKTAMSLNPRHFVWRYAGEILAVGLPSALHTLFANISNMVINRLASGYGDIPVAAFCIVKKIDMLPMRIGMGLCQGFMPLVGYNYSAKNYPRMRRVISFSWKAGFLITAACISIFWLFAPGILNIFMDDIPTAALGTQFLRIACLAVPFTTINVLAAYTLQSMGKGLQSLLLSCCRQGLFNIPLLFAMNVLVGMYGIIWTQLIADGITVILSFAIYFETVRKVEAGSPA